MIKSNIPVKVILFLFLILFNLQNLFSEQIHFSHYFGRETPLLPREDGLGPLINMAEIHKLYKLDESIESFKFFLISGDLSLLNFSGKNPILLNHLQQVKKKYNGIKNPVFGGLNIDLPHAFVKVGFAKNSQRVHGTLYYILIEDTWILEEVEFP